MTGRGMEALFIDDLVIQDLLDIVPGFIEGNVFEKGARIAYPGGGPDLDTQGAGVIAHRGKDRVAQELRQMVQVIGPEKDVDVRLIGLFGTIVFEAAAPGSPAGRCRHQLHQALGAGTGTGDAEKTTLLADERKHPGFGEMESGSLGLNLGLVGIGEEQGHIPGRIRMFRAVNAPVIPAQLEGLLGGCQVLERGQGRFDLAPLPLGFRQQSQAIEAQGALQQGTGFLLDIRPRWRRLGRQVKFLTSFFQSQ